MLATAGITISKNLLHTGPAQAYLKLQRHLNARPSFNLLYAMKLALEDRPWSSLTTGKNMLI
jgi:hypothetical protein